MKRIFLAVVILISVTAILSGCGSDTPEASEMPENASDVSEPSEQPKDQPSEVPEAQEPEVKPAGTLIEPEQLISKEEAATLLGEAVMDAEKTDQQVVGQKICIFEAADENSFRFLQISLTQQAYMPDNGMTPESTYESIVGAFDGDELDGIGDKAVFATPGLHIMAEGYYISIAGGNSDDEAVRAVLKEAGILAVQHLKEILG